MSSALCTLAKVYETSGLKKTPAAVKLTGASAMRDQNTQTRPASIDVRCLGCDRMQAVESGVSKKDAMAGVRPRIPSCKCGASYVTGGYIRWDWHCAERKARVKRAPKEQLLLQFG